jgi:hypothetical protein
MKTRRQQQRATTAPLSGLVGLPSLGIEGVGAMEKQPQSLAGQLVLAGMDEAEEERQRRRFPNNHNYDNRQARLF